MGSSNLAAERRLEVGLALLSGDSATAALSAFEAALELDPDYPEALFSRGQALEALGESRRAAASYRRYLEVAPADVMGAAVRLALIGAAPMPERLPGAYVRTLFDQYAPRFDKALLERLDYRAPVLLRQAVDAVRGPSAPPAAVLDLGCGTGLGGEAFKDIALWLEGVDLSPGMVARARARGIYDALAVADLAKAAAGAERRFDIVLAADVLAYLGDLGPVFQSVRRVLGPRGVFAFTVERTDEPGYRLGERHRFAHNELYVAAQAAAAGLEVVSVARDWSRTEAGAAVPGLVAVLRAHGDDALADGLAAGVVQSRGGGRLDA